MREWLRRLDPRKHFCFACDRWTLREHRAHQAIVAKLPVEWRRGIGYVPSRRGVPTEHDGIC
jgi:hypothetical protein